MRVGEPACANVSVKSMPCDASKAVPGECGEPIQSTFVALVVRCLSVFGAKKVLNDGDQDMDSSSGSRDDRALETSMLRHLDLLDMPVYLPEVLATLCTNLCHNQGRKPDMNGFPFQNIPQPRVIQHLYWKQ